jgi:glucose uptake protein
MLLPSTYALTMALLVLSILCWGSWAITLKKSSWRFELFYIDFSLGALLAAVVAAFTFGSMGTDLSVQDSFLLVSKRPILMAFAAGCIFNLANMLITGAVEVAGMTVAFPVGLGLALIVSVIWNYVSLQTGNVFLIFGGVLLLLIAVVLTAIAQSMIERTRRKAAAAAIAAAEAPADPNITAAAAARKKRAAEEQAGPGAMLGVWLALAGGLVMGMFYPVVGLAMDGELGFSNPFAVLMLFSIGILVSTFVYSLYFMNLPVKGLPVSFFAYFTGRLGQHGLGILGGMIWMTGACANFAAAAAQGEAKVGPAAFSYLLGHGAVVVSLIWGLLVWKEFAGDKGSATRVMGIVALLLLAGVGLVATASLS